MPTPFRFSWTTSIRCSIVASIVMSLLLLSSLVKKSQADSSEKRQNTEGRLTHVSLEDLGQILPKTISGGPGLQAFRRLSVRRRVLR